MEFTVYSNLSVHVQNYLNVETFKIPLLLRIKTCTFICMEHLSASLYISYILLKLV